MENLYNNIVDDEDQQHSDLLLQKRGSRMVHDESNKLMV